MRIRKIAQRAAALVVFSAAAALAVAAPAGAQGVATGTLAFSGDAGDYITGGGTASTLDGKAGLNGSVECTAPATVTLDGSVTRAEHNVIIRGTYSVQVACTPGAPVSGKASVDPAGSWCPPTGSGWTSPAGSAE